MENMVTLYIGTHNTTGLKYFGKSAVNFNIQDLLKYGGSGKYWRNHLKKHGKDISMEIYGIFHKDEVKEIALKFSKDNNIVKALNENGKKIWANLEPENGLNGGSIKGKLNPLYGRRWNMTEEQKESLRKPKSEEGRKNIAKACRKPERIAKISKANRGRKHTSITKDKMSANHADFNGENNPFFEKKHSKETKKKISEANKGRVKSDKELLELSIRNTGAGNPNAKVISIFNKENTIIATITGGIRKYLKENNLPSRLEKTYRENTKMLKGPHKGWYARELSKKYNIIAK